MASSPDLPWQGWWLTLPLLLKVISAAPSPPQAVPEPPLPTRFALCPASGQRAGTGAQLRPWAVGGQGGSGEKPNWGPSASRTAGAAGKERSYLSSKRAVLSGSSPPAWAGGPCAGAAMCCVSTDCTGGICGPMPRGRGCAAPRALPSC